MPDDPMPRQRRTVNVVTSYLTMTQPRHRERDQYHPEERVHDAHRARERVRYIDNDRLSLDEGNDYA